MVRSRPPWPLGDLPRGFGFWALRLLRLSCLGAPSDLLPVHLLPPIVNFRRSIFPLTHRHLALGRRLVLALALDLIEAVVMAHHPIVAEHAFRFLTQYRPQRPRSRARQVIVLLADRGHREAPVMLGAVFLLQVGVYPCQVIVTLHFFLPRRRAFLSN